MHEEFIARALVGGAGMGHKLAKIDSALPPLQLVFKDTVNGSTNFVTDPRSVAIRHSQPWGAVWNENDPSFNSTTVPFFKQLRQDNLHLGREAAMEKNGQRLSYLE